MIFIPLHENPTQAAKDLANFHIKKYVKSVTELLYVHISTNPGLYGDLSPSITKFNLPKYETKNEKWLNESVNNIAWLIEYGTEIFEQYFIRNGTNHRYSKDFTQLASVVMGTYMRASVDLNSSEHTPFMMCIPEMFIVFSDPIDTFRYYYVQTKPNLIKSGWGKDKNTPAPEWFDQPKYQQEIDTFEGGTKLAKMVAKYKDKSIKGQEKQMIYDFIKREADKMRVPVEQLVYAKFEKRERRYFTFTDDTGKQLIQRLIYMQFGSIPIFSVYQGKKKLKQVSIKMTDVEYIEFNNLLKFHKAKLRDELKKIKDNLLLAYCVKNQIESKYDTDIDYLNDVDDHVSKKDYDVELAAGLTMAIKANPYNKGIE